MTVISPVVRDNVSNQGTSCQCSVQYDCVYCYFFVISPYYLHSIVFFYFYTGNSLSLTSLFSPCSPPIVAKSNPDSMGINLLIPVPGAVNGTGLSLLEVTDVLLPLIESWLLLEMPIVFASPTEVIEGLLVDGFWVFHRVRYERECQSQRTIQASTYKKYG